MKNIFLIPTEQDSWLCLRDGELVHAVDGGGMLGYDPPRWLTQQLYITSEEEIVVGDWITDGYRVWKWRDDSSLLGRRKVVLATDDLLVADGVQSVGREFLEWYVKNPSCESVEVKHFGTCCGNQSITQCINCKKYDPVYKITIPQEEPKQEKSKSFKNMIQMSDAEWSQFRKDPHISKRRRVVYTEEDMQEYAVFSIECYRQGLPCIVAKDWFVKFKKR